MKIGLVLPSTPGYSETFFRNKILGLQQNGIKVILFVNDYKSDEYFLNCKVIKAPRLGGNKFKVVLNIFMQVLKMVLVSPRNSLKLFILNKKDKLSTTQNVKQVIANQFLLTEKLDWIHFGFGTMTLGRENVAQTIGAKMAVSFRGFDIGIYPLKHPNCYKSMFQKVNKIHVISDDLANLLYQEGLSEYKKIVKITPAIDTHFFLSEAKKENAILQFTTIARLHWKKGLENTLEALCLLNQQGIDFKYTIIGDGGEKERLIFAVKQLKLTEKVIFTGKLSSEKVKKQLEATDIYIQYSLQEGFCNAVLEAQAMGVLCIVSDAEGLSENVIDKVTGFVVPKQQPKLLFKKIKEVIDLDDAQKKELSLKAMERVQNEFTIEKQQQEFLNFYEEN
ncbi:glycosyltransferase family 4 protein [Flavobacterium terrae]|uniref:Colanic acid/amylovoran biosynthesis glycosyltransferase n=1 Tax=Flavobacterium terrae TaxID=415425 RepID=A0A1M6FR71_9FLAO|nr:glycosyltransferase family 4 protein [Flavobacterium terrae]SHJ00174.1 colanic acid/amylovoran biosynthesis glycosyltransferase [Flavobacterium terrae]